MRVAKKMLTEYASKIHLDAVKEEGQKSERLANIKSIMKNLHLSAEKAMEALGIPAVDFPKYRSLL